MEWNDRVVVLDHPIGQHKLAILRDKHTPSNAVSYTHLDVYKRQ